MIDKYKYIVGAVLFLLLLIASFLFGRYSVNDIGHLPVGFLINHDTTFIVKQSEPLIIKKYVPRLVYKSDTMILTKPFTAIVDTIIKKDTVYAKYDFPTNNFDLMIRKKPDSTLIQTITITKEIAKERPWWETPVFIIGGSVAGYLFGRISR